MSSQTFGQGSLVGLEIGHYRIVEKIGAGGMGDVYRARDEHLARDVAIKVLPPGTLTEGSARKHFHKEALVLSKLNHTNIATIYDFDTQQEVDFLVMEYISGTTLSKKLTTRPLPEKEVIGLGTQLAEGLAAAHDHGVVHRDLKPGNLRLTDDGRLKILDFGLAKLRLPVTASATTESLSETQALAGTLPYMAPEQLLGGEIDARTDIHAAGSVLYEMATGQRPFADVERSQLIGAILRRPPQLPTALNPRLSPELERIITKCLEKDPENRYQSAKELAVDLRRLAVSGTVSVAATIKSTRIWPFWVAGTSAATVLALLVLFALYLGDWRNRQVGSSSSRKIQRLAVLPLENLSRDPEQDFFTDGMTDALIANLSKISALRVISRTSVMRYKGARDPLAKIARELNVDAVIEGSVLHSGNRVRIIAELIDTDTDRNLWSEQYEGDLRDILVLQSNVAQAIAREIEVKIEPREQALFTNIRTINPEAYELYLRGRYYWNKRTQQGLEKALEYFKQSLDKDPSLALSYAGLADCYIILAGYNLRPPSEVYPLARVAAQKALAMDATLAEAHTSLASYIWDYEWNWQVGFREYQRAIELNPNYATAHQWYAESLVRFGRREEAIAEIQKAKELDPFSLIINAVQGFVYYFARQHGQAIAQLQNTLELDEAFYPTHVFLGWNYEQQGRYADALGHLQKALSLSGGSKYVTPGLAHVYAVAGQRAKAVQLLNQLQQASERTYVDPYDIGLVYAGLGNRDQAFDSLEQAYRGRSETLTFIKVDPRLDSLRSDRRFQNLLRRLNLPPD